MSVWVLLFMGLWALPLWAQTPPKPPSRSNLSNAVDQKNIQNPQQGQFYIQGMPKPKTASSKGNAQKKEEKKDEQGQSSPLIQVSVEEEDVDSKGQASLPPEKIYGGIIPGKRDVLGKKRRKAKSSKHNVLEWIGFIPSKDRVGSQLFIQTRTQPDYDIQKIDPLHFRIVLHHTRIHRANDRRALDTRYWPSAMISAKASSKHGQIWIDVVLQKSVEIHDRVEDNRIYLQFDDLEIQPYVPISSP